VKKIFILAGGYSKEREISLRTAKSVHQELIKDNDYNIKIQEPNGEFIKHLRKFKPDVVLNLLHGRYGEDGYVQSILETEKVKYTHSGLLSSALAMDKDLSKKIFIKNKILTPKYLKFSYNKILKKNIFLKLINSKFTFPVIIKPINEGSSVNVFICTRKNIFSNIQNSKNMGKYS